LRDSASSVHLSRGQVLGGKSVIAKHFGRLALAWLMALAALSTPASAQPADPPLQTPSAADFGAVPFLSSPVLSPDGTHVAAKGLVDGKTMVVIVDISTPERKLMRSGLPDKLQFESLRWAGNDHVLVGVSKLDHVFGDEVRITRLVLVDIHSSKSTLVGPREQGVIGDDIVYLDHDGKFLLLSAQANIFEYPSVYRVDLVSGKSTLLVRPRDGVWNWFADSNGVVRGGLETQEGKWWLLYRPGESGAFKRILRSDDGHDNNVQQFATVIGSDQGYAVADGKTGHLALYRYDFAASKLGELLYENPDYDIDDFSLGPDGQLRSVYYTDDRAEIAWFDPELKKLQARIDHALPERINRIASFSDDHSRALVWSGSATDPGAYLLYDRARHAMDVFTQPYEKLLGKQLAPMQPVKYAARDGLEIPGYLTLPPGRGDRNLPLVVMPHGGPYARDEWGYEPWVQYLASKGYAVLQPNFRGSTGFGRKYVEAGTGAWGRGMQDDIDDGVKWLAARGTVDAKRVCIMGASFGGYAAEWAAVRNPEMYRCAISFAGVSDVEAQLKYSRKSFSAPRYFRDWRERVKGDRSFELDQISPLKSVERMTVPILIAHGDDDDTVPVSQSRRLHDALIKLGRAHEYVIYQGESHGLDDPVHATDFLNRVGAFLDKYNPS
jgi:dipeptidyl aminopeptidase/acylaminoacyl peptidase